MTKLGPEWMRRSWMLAVLSLAVLVTGAALAAGGRVEWKSKTLKESDSHSWTIDVSIYMNKAPDVATLPMRFTFQPVIYYERTLMDGKEGPQLRRVPLEGKPPLVESVDVGFLDPGNGQIQKRTKFAFKVTRGHGFEAGEYDVTIKDGRTDSSFGSSTRLIFEGENEVIDRRAVVFTGEKKKEEKKDEEEKEEQPMKRELTPDDPGFWEGGPKQKAHGEDEEAVEPKRGCGCRVGGTDAGTDLLGAAGMAAAMALVSARRRARSRVTPSPRAP